MSDTFTRSAWKKVWGALDETTKQAIRDKAQWEHMSLSAVMKDWWPELWKQLIH